METSSPEQSGRGGAPAALQPLSRPTRGAVTRFPIYKVPSGLQLLSPFLVLVGTSIALGFFAPKGHGYFEAFLRSLLIGLTAGLPYFAIYFLFVEAWRCLVYFRNPEPEVRSTLAAGFGLFLFVTAALALAVVTPTVSKMLLPAPHSCFCGEGE